MEAAVKRVVQSSPSLVAIDGLPCSGKSTMAERLMARIVLAKRGTLHGYRAAESGRRVGCGSRCIKCQGTKISAPPLNRVRQIEGT
jgi:hypothetical protein